ncbi:hypothetical protein [Candidatus Lariskella endosymbiont of Epinotia ramella]|uniref:hypothetical protein n=1 Tax=Candidatus Lariskella endosymbiont of Epinotia ramella TaxID=3066224 RepID=UPI0030CB32F0
MNILEGFADNHTDASFTALALMATTMEKLNNFNAEDLAIIIHTIGNLKHSDSKEFEHAWIEAAANKLSDFKAADLAMSISALAKLNMRLDDINLIDKFIRAATQQLNKFTTKELAIIISALADLKHSNMQLAKEWIKSPANKLSELNTEDLTASISTLTKLELKLDDTEFENAWIEAANRKLNEFKPEELAMSISALAKLKLQKNNTIKHIDALIKESVKKIQVSMEKLIRKSGLDTLMNTQQMNDEWIEKATKRLDLLHNLFKAQSYRYQQVN